MAIATLAGPWFSQILTSSQDDTNERASNLVDSSQVSLNFESASFDSSSDNTSVVIRNTGSEKINGFSVTLIGGDNVQRQFNDVLAPGSITSVGLSSGSKPDFVRVDAVNMPISSEVGFEEVSDDGADGSSGSSGGVQAATVSAPSVGGEWSHVKPAGAEGGYDYFFNASTTPYGKTYGGNSSVEYTDDGFFIMKYQAAKNGTLPVSNGSVGWSDIVFNDAGGTPNAHGACENLDSRTSSYDVHLTTNREWMAVARQVAQNSTNWADRTVGSSGSSGGLYQGNYDGGGSYDRAVDLGEPKSKSAGGIEQRTHNLSTGDRVWDLSGDLFNWVDAEEDGAILSTSSSKLYEKNPKNSTVSNGDGLGTDYGFSDGDAALRSGDWFDGSDAGFFRAISFSPDYSYLGVGFRCSAVSIS